MDSFVWFEIIDELLNMKLKSIRSFQFRPLFEALIGPMSTETGGYNKRAGHLFLVVWLNFID